MYIDLLLILNFCFDFLILLCVSIVLKRNVSFKKIALGSFFGSFTIIILFININSFSLFLFKIFLSLIMIFITFGIKDFKYNFNNFLYFYTSSIILGGFLYFLKVNISYKNVGAFFFNHDMGFNYIFLVILSPIILYIYIKQAKELKRHYSLTYKVKIFLKKGVIIDASAYLDTANVLTTPYTKKNVILLNSKILRNYIRDNPYMLVPYDTIDSHGLLKCVSPLKVYIEGVGIRKNVVVAYNDTNYKMDGISCILNNMILEGK